MHLKLVKRVPFGASKMEMESGRDENMEYWPELF